MGNDLRAWHIPAEFNIGVACSDAHLHTPRADRPAMIVEDDDLGSSSLSFAGLARQTSRFAQVLRTLGVDAGARVVIRLANSLAYPTALLGTLKRGAIAVPASIQLTAEEIAYLVHDAAAAVLVCDRRAWPALQSRLAAELTLQAVLLCGPGEPARDERLTILDLDEALRGVTAWEPAHPTRAGDPAYLVYTSGSTGYPKGVLHAHRTLLGHAPAWDTWFNFGAEDRILHTGKFNWTYVLGSGLMDPLYLGQTVIVHEGRADATRWPVLIARQRATIFIGVPTVYRQILQKTAATAPDVPSLRHCMCAGEHLSDDVLGGWRTRFGLDIYEAIGMSECSYYMSQSIQRPIRPGSVGFPQPGHTVALLDDHLRPVRVGEQGMICIAQDDPGLFLRYWNLPDETTRVCRGGWFLTGDYARQDEDGYVWFLGRKDDIIKSFGYRVSPFEVERVLKDHPAVADCAVAGEEITAGKTLVAAYVVPVEGVNAAADDIMSFAATRLARYKCPRRIHFLTRLPRTANGKILRRALAESGIRKIGR